MGEPDDLSTSRHLVVSQRLRLRRRALGLTQKQVVTRLSRLGVTTTNKALSSLEHGAGLDLAKLPELARVLDCSITWLLGLTEDPRRWDPDPLRWEAVAGPEAAAGHPDLPPGPGGTAYPRPAAAAPTAAGGNGSTAHRSWILGPLPPER